MRHITSKYLLRNLGIAFIIISAMGYLGIIGPTANQSLFADFWWFSRSENIGYCVLGGCLILASQYLPNFFQQYFIRGLCAGGIIFCVISLTPLSVLGVHLERPADTIFIAFLTILLLLHLFKAPEKSTKM